MRPVSSSRIAASGSGSRSRARKLRRPAPQPGRPSSSSGRASVMIRIGTSRLHSSTWSMKSSVPESAQCRSSKTSATTCVAASRSKNVRQALNSSFRTARRSRADAEQGQQRGFDPAPLLRVRDVRVQHLADAQAGRLVVVGLDQAGPAADHLAERPERDALAVRRRAASCHRTGSTTPSTYFRNSQARRLLPMPALP